LYAGLESTLIGLTLIIVAIADFASTLPSIVTSFYVMNTIIRWKPCLIIQIAVVVVTTCII
jgi:hypothetical protein